MLLLSLGKIVVMKVRFADSSNKGNITTENKIADFVIRRRIPTWQLLSVAFAAVGVFSVVLGLLVDNILFFSELIFVVFVGLSTYVIILLQGSRDLVLATEFQNAILSSALSADDEFGLIIKNDSSVVYVTPSLLSLIPEFRLETRRSVDSFIEHAHVPKEQRKIIFSAIENGSKEKIIFDVVDSSMVTRRLVMSLQPLARPQGFVLLKGREFVEKRGGGENLSDSGGRSLFSKANFDLFARVVEASDITSYILDAEGRLVYASPKLEELLGYSSSEMVQRGLYVPDIVVGSAKSDVAKYLRSIEGAVQLYRKIGGHVYASVKQKELRGERNEIAGYVAILEQLDGDVRSNEVISSW